MTKPRKSTIVQPPPVTQKSYDGTPIETRPLQSSAGLFWVNGQYLFKWVEQDREISKFVSPGAVRAAFSHEPVDSDWLSPYVVRTGTSEKGEYEVLFIPPQTWTLNFTNAACFNMPGPSVVTLKLPLPGVLFMGLGGVYAVFALKDMAFDPTGLLYNMPLPNVYNTGRICWGSVTPGRAGPGQVIKAWQIFTDTPFSNHGIDHKAVSNAVDVRNLLAGLRDQPAFPLDQLIPTGNNLSVNNAFDTMVAKHGTD